MLAFLKGRWMLLSCALGLLACSMIHLTHSTSALTGNLVHFGITGGNIVFLDGDVYEVIGRIAAMNFRQRWTEKGTVYRIQSPMFGNMPRLQYGRSVFVVRLPLWLPLSAFVGWIVFRELRWREKRAR